MKIENEAGPNLKAMGKALKKKIDLKDLKLESIDVKGKLLVVNEADLSEEAMAELSVKLKKAGAIEVVYAYGGVDLKALTEEDLKSIGLCRIPEPSGKTH